MLSGSWATLTSRQFSGCLQCDKLVFRGHVRGVAWLATLKTTFSLGTLAFGQNNCHCWAQLQGPWANIPQGLPVNSSHGEIVSRQLYHTSQFVTVNSSQPHGQFVAPVRSSHRSNRHTGQFDTWPTCHMTNVNSLQCYSVMVWQPWFTCAQELGLCQHLCSSLCLATLIEGHLGYILLYVHNPFYLKNQHICHLSKIINNWITHTHRTDIYDTHTFNGT